jgi:hypothetical protein
MCGKKKARRKGSFSAMGPMLVIQIKASSRRRGINDSVYGNDILLVFQEGLAYLHQSDSVLPSMVKIFHSSNMIIINHQMNYLYEWSFFDSTSLTTLSQNYRLFASRLLLTGKQSSPTFKEMVYEVTNGVVTYKNTNFII